MTLSELRSISCCFTGHRIIKSVHSENIHELVYNKIVELHKQGYINFLTGGALGFDTVSAQCVLRAKQFYPSIRLILVLPCTSQSAKWNEEDVLTYELIKTMADKVICVSEEYTSDCMFKRNRFLVDYTSYCISYQYKNSGGTAYTTNYAKSKGHIIFNICD